MSGILYLARVDGASRQIVNKIWRQFVHIRHLLPNSHCLLLGSGLTWVKDAYEEIDTAQVDEEQDPLAFLHRISEVIERTRPKVIYMRYVRFDHRMLQLVQRFGNVVFEHQTLVGNELPRWDAMVEARYAPYVLSLSLGHVSVTDEIGRYQVERSLVPRPGYVMPNGVDEDEYPFTPLERSEGYHFLVVAYLNRWHGIDRLIAGVAHHRKSHRPESTRIHVIGDGPERPRLEEMAIRLGVADQVRFYGMMDKAEIQAVASMCQVAIGPLAIHRRRMSEECSLKNREYCLRGIPFVIAGIDPDFGKALSFVLKVPANDEPVDIVHLLEFARAIEGRLEVKHEAREYARANLCWSRKVEGMVRFATGLSSDPLNLLDDAPIPIRLAATVEHLDAGRTDAAKRVLGGARERSHPVLEWVTGELDELAAGIRDGGLAGEGDGRRVALVRAIQQYLALGLDPDEVVTKAAGRAMAVWGGGSRGRLVVAALRRHGVPVEVVVDSDPRKWGCMVEGVPVVGPDQVVENSRRWFVIVASTYAAEIVERLEMADFVCGDDLLVSA